MPIINKRIVIAHMKKCGGTSVCKGIVVALPSHSVKHWGYTLEGEKRSARSRRSGGIWKHSPVADTLAKLPKAHSALTVYLASLRPWWDRVCSYYFNAKRHNQLTGTKYAWVANMSFAEYIRRPYLEEVVYRDRFCKNSEGIVRPEHFVSYELMAGLRVQDASLSAHNMGHARFSDGYCMLYKLGDFAYKEETFAGESALCPVRSRAIGFEPHASVLGNTR
ncbi:hypothetical protein [Tritonibacter mobilis]|uniref:hypothetical protein n=1 Tax=Tritonibacter mobilis TaxID=379347 RepID=UPI00398FBB37